MRQHQAKALRQHQSLLTVVKGFKEDAALHELVNTAWSFAYTALWNTSIFSKREIEEAKICIEDFLLGAKDAEKAYSIFCQRVLLARQYISNNPNKFIPLPTIWLDKTNEAGFAGTKAWYDNIRTVRSSLPMYKSELRGFAEAILEMTQDPTETNFRYWRNYFIEKKAPGLLNLFLNTIANQQFGI